MYMFGTYDKSCWKQPPYRKQLGEPVSVVVSHPDC